MSEDKLYGIFKGTLYGFNIDHTKKKKKDKPKEVLQCGTCGRYFYDNADNICKFECVYHSTGMQRGEYICCGGDRRSEGCVRQDHAVGKQPLDIECHINDYPHVDPRYIIHLQGDRVRLKRRMVATEQSRFQ